MSSKAGPCQLLKRGRKRGLEGPCDLKRVCVYLWTRRKITEPTRHASVSLRRQRAAESHQSWAIYTGRNTPSYCRQDKHLLVVVHTSGWELAASTWGKSILNSFAPSAGSQTGIDQTDTYRMGFQLHAPLLLHAAVWLPPFPFCCQLLCWHPFFHRPLHSHHRSAWPHHPRCLLRSHYCPLWFVELLGFFLGRVQLK